MKIYVTESIFRDYFQKIRPTQFSYEGLGALYKYLEEIDNSDGIESDFDVVGICCTYSEYDNLAELKKDYKVYSIEELQRHTEVIMIDDESFIIRQY